MYMKSVFCLLVFLFFVFLFAQRQSGGRKDTSYRFLLAKNIQRPQLRFKDKIDNSNTPFIPIIAYKPNALKPLQQCKYISRTNTLYSFGLDIIHVLTLYPQLFCPMLVILDQSCSMSVAEMLF